MSAARKTRKRGGDGPKGSKKEERRFEASSSEEDPYDLSDLGDLRGRPRMSSNSRAVLAASLLAVMLYFAWSLRGDLAYLFAGFTATDLGKVADAFEAGNVAHLEHNSHVHVAGLPRYPPYTYTLDPDPTPPSENPDGVHMRMWTLSRTNSRFFVVQEVSNRIPPNVMETSWSGRLVSAEQYEQLANLKSEWARWSGEPFPAGAWVLLSGQTPKNQYLQWATLAFLLVVLPINGWSLVGWFRARRSRDDDDDD